jgi:hypothetical protein
MNTLRLLAALLAATGWLTAAVSAAFWVGPMKVGGPSRNDRPNAAFLLAIAFFMLLLSIAICLVQLAFNG